MLDITTITIASFLILPLSGLLMLPVLIERMTALENGRNNPALQRPLNRS